MQIKKFYSKIQVYWIIAIIPLIALSFSFLLKIATGPYWQFPDPCYGNLISSLSIIKGASPAYISSPGTPMQMLGAGIIYLLNLGHSRLDIIHTVLLNPETYLSAINTSMIILAFITSLILGAYGYRQTNDKLVVLLSQLPTLSYLALRSFSFYDYVPPVVGNVTPEPLMISVTNLFNLCLLMSFFNKKDGSQIAQALGLAFICGLGIACKLTFLPFVVIPFIVCRGISKLVFGVGVIVSFIFWTIPILPSYHLIWSWIIKLSTHVGEYGSGAKGFINPSQYLWSWQVIYSRCTMAILFALAALLFSFVQVIGKRSLSKENKFLWAIALSIVLQFALTAKHYDDHYLASVINLFAPLFVIGYLSVKNRNVFFKAAVFLYILLFSIQAVGHAIAYNRQLSSYTQDAVSFNHMLHAKYPNFIFIGVFPMPMANPEGAFFMANDWDNSQQDQLAKLYPNNLAYFSNNINTFAPYVSGIYSITRRVWADDLISLGVHVIFVAPKAYDFSVAPYTFLPLEQGKYAAAYLLVASTEKEANKFFDVAVKLSADGDFPHAFAFAMKSRELHYQPVERVNYFLTLIYPHIKR